MMFKMTTKILIVLIVSGFFINKDCLSQTPTQALRIIEKLNTELKFVRELVQAFNHRQALELVIRAEKLRNEAVVAIKNKAFIVADNKVKLAFTLLEKARKITLDGPVGRWRSRLEELLRRADQEVLGSRHKEAERILQRAKKNRDAAERAFINRNLTKALEHYRVAVDLAKRALDLVQSYNNPVLDKILEAKKRFEVLRARAHSLVEKSADVRAKQIFEQAIKLYRAAEEAIKKRNFQLAKKFYNQSILLLLRAIDITNGESPESINPVQMALFRLRELIENSKDIIQSANLPRAMLLFERAKRFASEAELAARNGRKNAALRKIELAENIIKRAIRIAQNKSRPNISNRITQEIENTKSDISDTENQITADSPIDAKVLINMSKVMVNRAEQSASAGFTRFALESILAAQRFLTKAENVLIEQETSPISQERIQTRLNQLDEVISDSERKIAISNQQWNRRLFEGAKEIRKFVVESLERGNYRAAEEGIKVAFELLQKSLKDVSK